MSWQSWASWVWCGILGAALAGCSEGGPSTAMGPSTMGDPNGPTAGLGGVAGMAAPGAAGTGMTAMTAGSGGPGAGTFAQPAGAGAEAGSNAPPSGAGMGGMGGGGTAGGEPEPATPCTGKPGAPGDSARMVRNGTLDRTFIVHVPASADPNEPLPVLFVHHGFTMTGQIMKDVTGFDAIADSEGFIAVYPDGGGAAPWNVGTSICGVGAVVAGVEDDFAFVEKMLDDIERDQCIDREHVFTTGFSMGGYFSNHMGCQNGNRLVRAVAPHSGGTYPGDCPGAPLPVMILHGTADALITPDCGTDARDLWVARNGCSMQAETRPVTGGTCEWYSGCPEGGQVVFCAFDGMAHGWAGASTAGANGLYGGGEQFESASRLVWDFFEAQF